MASKVLHLLIGRPGRDALRDCLTWTGSEVWQGNADKPVSGRVDALFITDTRPRLVCEYGENLTILKRRNQVFYVADRFWSYSPPVVWPAVLSRLGWGNVQLPKTVQGQDLKLLVQSLEAEYESPTPLKALEGKRIKTTKLSRNPGLRDAAVMASEGVCAACDTDFTTVLDGAGLDALHAHHVAGLSVRACDGPVENSVEDLAVLCATCHELIHATGRSPMQVAQLRLALRRS